MALSVQRNSEVIARNCRFTDSIGSGVSLIGSSGKFYGCIMDYNASGVSVNGGALEMENCVIHSNKLEGIGVSVSLREDEEPAVDAGSKEASIALNRCNVFSHKLNGVELHQISTVSIRDCNIHDNLNGVLVWLKSEAEAAIEKTIENSNNVHDNRRAQVRAKFLPPGKTLVDEAIETRQCTFSLTGPHFFRQRVFNCHTCNMVGRVGCCQVSQRKILLVFCFNFEKNFHRFALKFVTKDTRHRKHTRLRKHLKNVVANHRF
jgi:hypothetical protein